jgi:DNA polymerase
MQLNIDIETFSSVDLKKSGLCRYAVSPNFSILLFAYSVDGGAVQIVDLAQGEQMPLWLIQALASKEVVKHAFNATFEWTCINRFWPTPLESWRCSMVHSLYCGFTTALGTAGEAIGLPQDKRKLGTGMALIRTFCCPVKPTASNGEKVRILPQLEPAKWELFKTYCKQDVEAEMALERKLVKFPVPPSEWYLWELDHRINSRGVAVDEVLINSAISMGADHTKRLFQEAVSLTGLENPNSRNQLIRWLSTECEETVDKLDKETVRKMLGESVPDSTINRVLTIRQEMAKTSIAKYDAMLKTVHGGRIRGLVQFYGANRTGRYAGRLVQVHNLPRNHLQPLGFARELVKDGKSEAIKLVFGNIPDTLSQLIRTAFIAPEGKLLVVADYASIEVRVLAALAQEKWLMDVFAGHGKIYEATAAEMFKLDINTIVKGGANYEARQKAKVAVLACGYGGSVGALISMGALDMGIPESELPGIIERWRQANPNIVKFWYTIGDAAFDVVKNCRGSTVNGLTFRREMADGLDFMTIQLPSGRKLFYAFPHLCVNRWGNESVAYKGMNQTTKKWTVVETYSGKLVENIVQAVARDCLAFALVQVEKAGFDTVMHIHDEVVVEVEAERAEEALNKICEIMSYQMPWAKGLLLKGAGFVNKYYMKE